VTAKRSLAAASLGVSLLVAGCAGGPTADPRYRPAESVLEVIAVLRRHVPDDTYRFESARDFTGRNVYRASLIRLENVTGQPDTAFRLGHYALLNLLAHPTEDWMLGPELQWARRYNFRDDYTYDDFRIQFSVKYAFAHSMGKK
jgi:hypothetical protein